MTEGKKKLSSKHYGWMRAIQKVDRTVRRGMDLTSIVSKIGKKPTMSKVVHAGLSLTQQALNLNFFDQFKIDNWASFYPSESDVKCFLDLLERFPCRVEQDGVNNNSQTRFYNVFDATIARKNDNSRMYYRSEEISWAKLNALLARAVWETNGSPLMMKITGTHSKTVYDYKRADIGELYDSQVSRDIVEWVRPFIEGGESRSLMLWGPPGTGKSVIINKLASEFGKRVLLVDSGDLYFTSPTQLANKIIWLQPDVLVINDFDRFSGTGTMLTVLEDLIKQLTVFMVSVNDTGRLPAAVRSRFHKDFCIERLDSRVALDLIGLDRNQIPNLVWEQLINWPARFLAELGRRVKFLGAEKLTEEFSDMQRRVENNYDDNPRKRKEEEAKKEKAELIQAVIKAVKDNEDGTKTIEAEVPEGVEIITEKKDEAA